MRKLKLNWSRRFVPAFYFNAKKLSPVFLIVSGIIFHLSGVSSQANSQNNAVSGVVANDTNPAIIHIRNFDLALRKKALRNNARPGELVNFEIEVFNQGTIPADNITIVDYIPPKLTLEDPNWTLDPSDSNKALYLASIADGTLPLLGLAANKSVVIPIQFRVKANQGLGLITNAAEIKSAFDVFGNNFGIYDEDSTPDDNPNNDNGGIPGTSTDDQINDSGTIDEDDADPAQIYVTMLSLTADCICKSNATNGTNGQFEDELTLTAPSGQTWFIHSVNGFYDMLSPAPPAAPLSYSIGSMGVQMLETVIGSGYSNYSLRGIHIDGQGYAVVFENNQGDRESFERAAGSACKYENLTINGARGTCSGATENYNIANPNPGSIYTWTLSGGGIIVGSNVGTAITIEWGISLGGPHTLSVDISNANCQAPGSIEIAIGSPAGTLTSRDVLNTSVDQNCEAEIKAELILTMGFDPNTVYSIVLITPDGTKLPSNVITSEYLGIPLLAKLKDLCGGNTASCIVTGIDNIRPVIDCVDDVVLCDNMDSYPGPVVLDNCDSDPEVILINELIFMEDCNSIYSERIERTYVAVDQAGNQSDPCTMTIFIERASMEGLRFPQDYLISDNSALVCNAYPTCPTCDCDTFPYPDPLATGVPIMNGNAIYPSSIGHCQFVVGFKDVVIANTSCYKKVRRYWNVHEICDGINIFNIVTHIQEIEIIDNIPPLPVAPSNILMTTDGESCGSFVQLPELTIQDNCSTEFVVDITYPGGFIEHSNGAYLWLPRGENTVLYTIYDECNNYSQLEMKVTIEDNTAPVAICQNNTVVSLSNDGFAEVPADVFDSGSYDGCSIVKLEVMRMEEGISCGLVQNNFGPTITFCCEDVGNPVVVVLRVYDESGNWSECMVDVEVQDVNAPVLEIPANVTIECDFPYNLEDLSNFGTASVYDVCGATIVEDKFVEINSCGVGYIDRLFFASDGVNHVSKVQRITIVNSKPFDPINIQWPLDYMTAESCNAGDLNPENLNVAYAYPIIHNEDYCAMVGFNYEDYIFPIENEGNACYKIIRTWKAIDWCQYEDDKYKFWTWDQIIMVSNTQAPEITSDLSPLSICSYDENCEEGFVELKATGNDDCTPGSNLNWYYAIDLFDDGIVDEEGNYIGLTIDKSAYYPIGTHKIFWTLEDFCGNKVVATQEFTVKNCKKPTAVCIDALAVAIQPADTDGDGIADTELAFIEAKDFDGGSYHSCGYPLKYSFSSDTADYFMWVDCKDLSISGITINLYVTDIFGNYDFCITTLFVQDNNNVDICDVYENCLIFPEGELEVAGCNPDLSPEGLGSFFTIHGDCPCQDFTTSYVDVDISDPTNTCTTLQRNWTVGFGCGLEKVYTFQQIITVLNVSAPQLFCSSNIEMDSPSNCEVFVHIPVPQISSDVCNTGLFVVHNSPYADTPGSNASGYYPVGTTTITFTLTDDCGNQTTCDMLISVNDVTAPICVSNDLTVLLGAGGVVTIAGADVGGASTDECGVAALTVSPNTFSCEDIGENAVTITVLDVNGLSSTCTAIVTVEDNSGPLCATQDISVLLDENGMYVVDPVEVYTGYPCGALDVTLVLVPDTFTCDDLGENLVTLTVTEANGNSESCTAIITVSDTIAPVCILQDIDAFLDVNGELIISFEDIDNGTNDPCGEIIDTSLSNTFFTCNDVGEQFVTVTLEDNSGNVTICEAMLTVIDSISPVCLSNDLTVFLGDSGMVSIVGEDVGSGSSDECGIASIDVTPSSFDCFDVGDNTVIITVEDTNGQTSTCTAIVTVVDNSAPLCSTQDISVILEGTGMIIVDPAAIYTGTSCGGLDVSLEMVPDTFYCDDIGDNVVTLTVTEQNGNTESCTAIITVSDTIAPECIVQDIDVYLDENGNASIIFEDIDNGTNDPCGEIIDTTLILSDFTCDNLGDNTVLVTLEDNSGNVSTCEATVTVIDTIAPVCIAIDISVNLDASGMVVITGQQIDGGSFDQCTGVSLFASPDTFFCSDVGVVEVELTVMDDFGNTSICTSMVEILDVIPPEISCPADTSIACTEAPISDYTLYGEATAVDECTTGMTISETIIESTNACGIGIVTRNFTVNDNSGNTATCSQIITIEASDPPFSEANIVWGPDTINTDGCTSLDINVIGGAPSYLPGDVECYLLSESFEDVDLNPGEECYDTIQRTWTVIDSCQLQAGTSDGIFIFEQMIISIDSILPEIFAPQDTVICDVDYVNLWGYATDCGTQDSVTVTNDSPYADDPNSADASGDYPFGEYDITITATDMCGNVSTYTYHLSVFEAWGTCQKITRDVDDTGIYVLYLDEIFYPNYGCYDTTIYKFSLSDTNENQDTLHFGCADLGGAAFVDIPVPVYLWENGVFIQQYCEGTLTLEDNFGFCDDSGIAFIDGMIETAAGDGIENVSVLLTGEEEMTDQTLASGEYAFPAFVKGGNYLVEPVKNDDIMKGINTLDLILMQRHILGLEILDTPEEQIAADVNKSGSISAADIFELRNLLLGIRDDFSNNNSWRFVSRTYAFENPDNVLTREFPEVFYIEGLSNNKAVDFLGVKTGDVNNSVVANQLMSMNGRQSDIVELHTDVDRISAMGSVSIPIQLRNEQWMNGIQFTLKFDPKVLEFEDISGDKFDVASNNYGIRYIEKGLVSFSWNVVNPISIEEEDVLFTIHFNAMETGLLSDIMEISSEITNAEWYGLNSSTKSIDISFGKNSEFEIFQNMPNPWTNTTNLMYSIPEAAEVKITIRDVYGRMINRFDVNSNKGLNKFTLQQKDLSTKGILIFEIEYNGQRLNKKMIKIN